ncbi:MAG: hypothetical protein ACYTKD_18735 [Planctomycetota bacterium]|jgi:hypothetical protein
MLLLTLHGCGLPFHYDDTHIKLGKLRVPGTLGNAYGIGTVDFEICGRIVPGNPNAVRPLWQIVHAPPASWNAVAEYVRGYAWKSAEGGNDDAEYRWDFHEPLYDPREFTPCEP